MITKLVKSLLVCLESKTAFALNDCCLEHQVSKILKAQTKVHLQKDKSKDKKQMMIFLPDSKYRWQSENSSNH